METKADELTRRIVVGVSDAETSHFTARRAVMLATAMGATVHFVTAVEKPAHEEVSVGSDVFHLDDVEKAQESIERFVRELDLSIEYTVNAVEGAPAKALINEATRLHADLIVVGNVRMQGIGRVLGSVGNDVVHHSPCDVLIVKSV